jgi:hypothetical protein
MSIKTLHKWFFSFTLIVSLVSFQGYATSITKTLATTEWIVSEHLVIEAPAYYSSFAAHQLKSTSNSFANFNFESFIHTQEIFYCLKFKLQKQTVLRLENLNTVLQLKRIFSANTDDFHSHFIG